MMQRKVSWKYYVMMAGLSLVFAAIACNTPSGAGGETPTVDPAQMSPTSESGTSIPTTEEAGTEPSSETSTPAPPTETPTEICNYDSVFVSDVTIPDDTEVVAGTGFTKTWRIQNNGCLPWQTGTVLLFVEGEQMGGPVSVPVPATAPGGTQDISVSLTAPAAPGEHKGYWRLRSSDGIQLGDKIYVQIISVAPTPTLTLTPTTPPPPSLPDLYVNEFSLNPATPVQGSSVHVRIGIYNKGTAATGGSFIVRWYGGESFASPSCEWNIGNLVKNGGVIKECDFVFNSWYGSINTKVVVDVGDAIEESDETNNIFLKAISVSKP
ncbi:MAG: hypothetical protein JXB30_04420 [Anaerolineae bacterium]|nr:hypothetical protein [Anaerolineae bacterium]